MAGPVAILAGSGKLPLQLVERLERQGRDHRILAFRGFVKILFAPAAEAAMPRRAVAAV